MARFAENADEIAHCRTFAPVPELTLIHALILAAVVGAWIGLRLARRVRAWRSRRRTRRGHQGEGRALRLLARRGYAIVETQPPTAGELLVDGERIEFEVRADAIVERKRRRYVAEIKTGRAASVRSRHTRRQLLEYALLYDADGVLLVDATRATIHTIEFPALVALRSARGDAHRSR